MAAIILETQERERKAIGMELHDNVNQILASTKLLLSAVENVSGSDRALIESCMQNLQRAIEENRRISHEMVLQDFKEQKLTEMIDALLESMLKPTGVHINADYTGLNEKILRSEQKLAIFRIIQEQCTNITKYAKARNVNIILCTNNGRFYMKIADDGRGLQQNKKPKGIGMQNIANRITVLHGTSYIHSVPGNGFSLEVEIPLAA